METTPVEEAEDLAKRIFNALKAIHGDHMLYKEEEVQFRFQAVFGVLLMAEHDVDELITELKMGKR